MIFFNEEEDSISNWDDSISNWDYFISNWDDFIKSWDDSISNRNDSISNWDDSISNWDDSISNRNDSISNWDDSISNWDDFIKSWDDSISNWDDSISNWDDSINSWDDSISIPLMNQNIRGNGRSQRAEPWGSGYESRRSRNHPFFNRIVMFRQETKEIQKNIAKIHGKCLFKTLKDIMQKKFKLERQEKRSQVIFFNKLFYYRERYQYLQEYFQLHQQSHFSLPSNP